MDNSWHSLNRIKKLIVSCNSLPCIFSFQIKVPWGIPESEGLSITLQQSDCVSRSHQLKVFVFLELEPDLLNL